MRDQGVQRPVVLAASQEEYALGFPKPISVDFPRFEGKDPSC